MFQLMFNNARREIKSFSLLLKSVCVLVIPEGLEWTLQDR
jgi:hypothetical protein